MFRRVNINRLVITAMHPQIGLAVALEVKFANGYLP
jgi:hypothetical protein